MKIQLNQTQKQKLKELIGLTIGQSSMLWTIRPIGIFKSDEAISYLRRDV